MQSFLKTWTGWIKEPFDTPGNLMNWVLVTIIAATLAYCWTRVLDAHDVGDFIQEITP